MDWLLVWYGGRRFQKATEQIELFAILAQPSKPLPLRISRCCRCSSKANRKIRLEATKAALRSWVAWFRLCYWQPISLLVPVPAVIQFIVDHAQRKTAAGLECELPESVDQALIDVGCKAALGPLPVCCRAHD